MEYDRYQQNHKMYFIAILSLLVSLVLLALSLYILPHLLWDLQYTVPYLVTYLLATLQEDYLMRPAFSKLLVFLLFALPGLAAGFLAYYASNRIENALFQEQIHPEGEEVEENPQAEMRAMLDKRKAQRDSWLFAAKILGLMFILISTILFIQSLI